MPDAPPVKASRPVRRLSPQQLGKMIAGSVLSVAAGALLMIVWGQHFLFDASIVGLNIVLFIALHWHHTSRPGAPALPPPPREDVRQLSTMAAAAVRDARNLVWLWATLPIVYGGVIYSSWHFGEASLWPDALIWPLMGLVGLYGFFTAFVCYIELRFLNDMLVGAVLKAPSGEGGEE